MTKPSDPLSVDFAALRTLRMVHALGSFSRAAETLGITQSTVSYTIDRLRRIFGDPLFVRQGGGTVPTDRCNEIVSTAARMTDEFSAILEPRAFDPFKAQAEVTLSCNYYERITLLPHLVRILRQKAPGLRVRVLSSNVLGKDQLERGESDMLIGPVRIDDSGYYRRNLLRDHYVCIMAKDNPLVGVDLDTQTYLAAPHVVVIYGGTWQSRYLVEIEARGHSLNAVVEVPSPAALPMTLQGTDLISTVPKRIALAFGDAVHVAPTPIKAPFDIDLYWNARTHHSAMHRWLRAQLADHVAPACGTV
ncbi:LysR family transcriptional regulator [Arenibacterium sp. CAU 1754]